MTKPPNPITHSGSPKPITFLLLTAIFISLNSCGDSSIDCSRGNLQFQLPLQAYGIKDTLQVGDTIRIRLDVPDRMPEHYSGYMYDFIDYDFKLATYVVKIDSLPTNTNSAASCQWITLEGESKYVSTGAYFVFPVYYDHTYHYEVLIVTKKKGLFVFGMYSDGWRLNPLEKLEGPCSREPVHAFLELINDSNTNFEFMKYSPDPAEANFDKQRFDDAASFCFFVR